MNTRNIQFHTKIRKISLNICFLELSEEFRRIQKRVRISLGKVAIGVRATEVRLYMYYLISLLVSLVGYSMSL